VAATAIAVAICSAREWPAANSGPPTATSLRPGADQFAGGAGNNRIRGGSAADTLRRGLGLDRVDGGPGTDVCFGETKTTCE